MRTIPVLLACSLAACGGGSDDTGAEPDAATAVDAPGANTIGGCATDALDRCDYAPAAPAASRW